MPKFLRKLFKLSGAGSSAMRDTAPAVTAKLSIAAFFYAMRSCEHTTSRTPGRTKIIDIRHITLRNWRKNILPFPCNVSDPEYVTIVFMDQKNGKKMDVQTQQQTGDPVLCPVLPFHSLQSRIARNVPNHTDDTIINTLHLAGRTVSISSLYLLRQLRSTCSLGGGKPAFGFTPADIRTHLLRSGGTMALFLHDNTIPKIMIFGPWSSDAFLIYILSQVLEWTTNMSHDMIKHDTFIGATDTHNKDPQT
jgi:hypothetical protein